MLSLFLFSKSWNRALCSESTGINFDLDVWSNFFMYGPKVTRVSLFAIPIFFQACIAATVGLIPTEPTIAVITISTSDSVTISLKLSNP